MADRVVGAPAIALLKCCNILRKGAQHAHGCGRSRERAWPRASTEIWWREFETHSRVANGLPALGGAEREKTRTTAGTLLVEPCRFLNILVPDEKVFGV